MYIYKSDKSSAVMQRGISIRFLVVWFGLFEAGSHYAGIASQELRDPPTSASQNAGIKGKQHLAQLRICLFLRGYQLSVPEQRIMMHTYVGLDPQRGGVCVYED